MCHVGQWEQKVQQPVRTKHLLHVLIHATTIFSHPLLVLVPCRSQHDHDDLRPCQKHSSNHCCEAHAAEEGHVDKVTGQVSQQPLGDGEWWDEVVEVSTERVHVVAGVDVVPRHVGRVQQADVAVDEEHGEIALVAQSDARSRHEAVMVTLEDTALTHGAVVGARRCHAHTVRALHPASVQQGVVTTVPTRVIEAVTDARQCQVHQGVECDEDGDKLCNTIVER